MNLMEENVKKRKKLLTDDRHMCYSIRVAAKRESITLKQALKKVKKVLDKRKTMRYNK